MGSLSPFLRSLFAGLFAVPFRLARLVPSVFTLISVSRSARANGVELLLPYADRRMFELSAAIPSDLKWRDGCGKYILRRTAE